MKQEDLHKYLAEFLLEYYEKESMIVEDGEYIFARGDMDVLLVAHLDTVHKTQVKLEDIWYDQEKNMMIAPSCGIGADDRCGIFIIMNLIMQGYRPHVAFPWNEESGGLGSRFMVKDFDPKKSGMSINFAIEFDRRGHQQAVFYDLDNKDFEKYICDFGFNLEYGSYTDICEICPEWEFAGVNLSTGYMKEHTNLEEVWLNTIEDTFKKSCLILDDQLANPQFFEWKEKYYPKATTTYSYYKGGSVSKKNPYTWEDEEHDDDYYYSKAYSKYRYNSFDDSDLVMCDYCSVTKVPYQMYRINSPHDGGSVCWTCQDYFDDKEAQAEEESFYKRTLKEVNSL